MIASYICQSQSISRQVTNLTAFDFPLGSGYLLMIYSTHLAESTYEQFMKGRITMNRLVLSVTLLLVAVALAGCYTQIGYYEPRPSTRQPAYHHQEKHEHRDGDETVAPEQEEQQEVEVEREASESGDEGYYGRRKPSYSDSSRYYRSYYDDDYYPVYPYSYGGYHPLYPYYGYSHPYYSYYGYYPYYGGYRYRPYRHRYSKPLSRIGDLNFGKRRSQSYRGVRSSQPSSRRSDRSLMKREENKAPARRSSDSWHDRSRRSRRR